MSLAISTVVTRVRRVLNDNPFEDVTASDPGTSTRGSTSNLTVADTTLYTPGNWIEFQDDGEAALVVSLTSGTVMVIRRGHKDTAASESTGATAAHAVGTRILKQPVFSYYEVRRAVSSVVTTLWPLAWVLKQDTLSPVSGTTWYSASAGVVDVSSAVQMSTTTPSTPKFYMGRKGSYPLAVVQGLPTASFTNGVAYYIPHLFNTTNTILVNAIKRITDDLTTTNYNDLSDDSALTEAVVLLAAAYLVRSLDIQRTTQQDISMGDETITPGNRLSIAERIEEKGYQKLRLYRIELETTVPRPSHWRGNNTIVGS